MNSTNGNEGALILAQQKRLLIMGDPGRPLDDNPMFRPVVVILKRELSTWRHSDPLHLIAVSLRQALIGSPRARHAAMVLDLGPASFLKLPYNLAQILKGGFDLRPATHRACR